MGIAQNISLFRRKAGLTQRGLALELGVTPSAVGNYEQGVSFPREEILYKLFDALDCTPNELFGYDEQPEAVPIAARKGGGVIALKKRGSGSILDEPNLNN